MRMYPDTGSLELHTGTPGASVTHRVDDRVLQLQRAKMSVGDGRMMPAEVARQGGIRPEVSGPIGATHSRIKRISVGGLESRQLQEDPIRHPRPKPGAIRNLQRSRKADAG